MKFDDLLKTLGEFGLYQRRLYVFVVLPALFQALQTMNFVFLLGTHKHSCRIPSFYKNVSENDANISVSATECELFVHNNFTNSTERIECTAWDYDKTEYIKSATSEFNLVCDDKVFKSHASMTSFGGYIAAAIIMGAFGDIIGRRKVLCINVVLMFFSDLSLAFSPSIQVFAAIHFVSGFSHMGYFAIALITVLELVGPSQRIKAGIIIDCVFAGGSFLLGLSAFFIRNWRHLQLAISIPAVIILPCLYFIPESPRWLLSQGRKVEALKIIRKIAKVNKVDCPKDLDDLEEETACKFTEVIPQILKSRQLVLRWIILTYSWSIISMSYYGISYNVGNVGNDVYLNYFLSTTVELFGYLICIFLAERLGRKPLHCCTLILAGMSCFSAIFAYLYGGEYQSVIMVTLSMIGKFELSAAFANVYVYTPELFPTNIRSFVLGTCNIARIGQLFSPYITNIPDFVNSDFGKALPLIIYGSLAMSAGILSIYLPETLNTKLPDTIPEAIYQIKCAEKSSLEEENSAETHLNEI